MDLETKLHPGSRCFVLRYQDYEHQPTKDTTLARLCNLQLKGSRLILWHREQELGTFAPKQTLPAKPTAWLAPSGWFQIALNAANGSSSAVETQFIAEDPQHAIQITR